MSEPRWVPRQVVDAAHHEQLREHGGEPGVRDEGALEAALARAHLMWKKDSSVDLALLAAAYAYGLARERPFHDGNKRTAFLAMMVFLGLNGADIRPTETDVVQTMIALADEVLGEDEMAAWVRARR